MIIQYTTDLDSHGFGVVFFHFRMYNNSWTQHLPVVAVELIQPFYQINCHIGWLKLRIIV